MDKHATGTRAAVTLQRKTPLAHLTMVMNRLSVWYGQITQGWDGR